MIGATWTMLSNVWITFKKKKKIGDKLVCKTYIVKFVVSLVYFEWINHINNIFEVKNYNIKNKLNII